MLPDRRCHTPTVVKSRRACAARVTVLGLSVSLSVCLSVDAYSHTAGYKAANELQYTSFRY